MTVKTSSCLLEFMKTREKRRRQLSVTGINQDLSISPKVSRSTSVNLAWKDGLRALFAIESMRTFPKALAESRNIVSERTERLRNLDFEELKRLSNESVEQI